MNTPEIIILIVATLSLIVNVVMFSLYVAKNKSRGQSTNDNTDFLMEQFEGLRNLLLSDSHRLMAIEFDKSTESIKQFISGITSQTNTHNLVMQDNIKALVDNQTKSATDMATHIRTDIHTIRQEIEGKLDGIRKTLEERMSELTAKTEGALTDMNKNNYAQLDKLNETVNEKLQKTLNDRLTSSFELVTTQLADVNKNLGEVQGLTTTANSINQLLSGIKTRGIWGEVSLDNILQQMLTADQYHSQFALDAKSKERVDFAIVLPGQEDGKPVYMPIDAKFPMTDYGQLVDASNAADKIGVENARKKLFSAIKIEAKSISKKYILPPTTTNFAIMFLPNEGLYSEIVRDSSLVDELHSQYNIMIAGPTTITALINALKVGFRTLVIQKKAGEIVKTLGDVKKYLAKFLDKLESTRKKSVGIADDMVSAIGIVNKVSGKVGKLDNSIPKVELPGEGDDFVEGIND